MRATNVVKDYVRIISELRDKVRLLEDQAIEREKLIMELFEEYAKAVVRCAELENPEVFNEE